MKILYIGNYIDEAYFQTICSITKKSPLQNIQKFNKLFVSGLEENSKVDKIDMLTFAPINREMSNRLFWKGRNYSSRKIHFHYIPFMNIKILKQISLAFFTFFIALYWCFKNRGNKTEKVVIADGFLPIVSTIGIIMCKLVRIKVIVLYTDLPKINANDVFIKNENVLRKIIKFIINIGDYVNTNLSDGYILLTKYMNDIVNKHHKPYVVIEGFVDVNFKNIDDIKRKKAIMYAGGLYETYGVKLLIEAFIEWNHEDYELWLFGENGDLLDYINHLNQKNIKFFGTLPNEEIIRLEQECWLLVNPRFTNELYTKYSFPSKNIEYMASGTPLLTTKLPGIPEEYNDYVFFIEEETKTGIIKSFNKIFDKPKKELELFGKHAQQFVLKNKNHIVQTEKILDMIQNDIENKSHFGDLPSNIH